MTAAAPETAATPGQAASDWWVCTGILPPHGTGQKITGPFATQELALSVRTYVEKAEWRTDLWVDDEARQPQPAPGGKRDPLSCPCCVFRGDDCWCRTDCGAERCQARDPEPAPGRAELETAMATVLQELIDEDEAVQPAPELAAAMAETRRYREALEQVAKHHGSDMTTAHARTFTRIARRALEGK